MLLLRCTCCASAMCICLVHLPCASAMCIHSHLVDAQVPPNYDSLLGKLIVWAEDRPAAINRMRRALNELVISGVPTTIQYHTMILDLEDFQKGNVDTGFIPSHAEELKEPPPSPKAVGVVPCCYPSCS